MDNSASKSELDYTMLAEKYRGYTVEWATSPSRSESGKWMGHYRALKSGAKTLAASVANLQDNPADAQNAAVRIAKATIDETGGTE